MSPAEAIAMLDRQIMAHGQTVSLRKKAALDASQDKPMQAFVRGYKPDELSGGINQGDSTMVFSPTQLTASGYAGAPARLDKVTIAGRLRNIEVANPVEIQGVIVRWECWVRG
jgi:hypothetical protein